MKNVKRFLAVVLAVLMSVSAFALIACNKTEKLATPEVTVNESGLASWKAVENATGYAYKINNGEEKTTDKLSVQLENGQTVVVKALGDGKTYSDSDYSASKKYESAAGVKLAVPVVTIAENGEASWDAVANASGYKYKINGGAEHNTTSRKVTLTKGQKITVKAVGDGVNYLDSDYSAEKTYNGGSSVSNKLATPVVSIDSEGKATWEAVANALGYKYKVDGGEEQSVAKDGKLEVLLGVGSKITVKAVGDGVDYSDSDWSAEKTFTVQEYSYETNPDVIQDGNVRYTVYTTNKTSGERDNVIAVKKGEKDGNDFVYGNRNIAVEGGVGAWDAYIGSASIVKGTFNKGGEVYGWLIAYSASANAKETANQIGLAVAKDPMGEWTKLNADEPLIAFDATEYGENMAGCYSPSLVNYNKTSGIRLYYTYADKFGHFARFFDADMSNLDNIEGETQMYLPVNGDYNGEKMFPNADWAYDASTQKFYAVKDVSPTPSTIPQVSDQFEIMFINENELYTAEQGEGWKSLALLSDITLGLGDYDEENAFARAYSACVVSDAYGHILDTASIEIVFNTCIQGTDYLYTQVLKTYVYTAPAE